MIMKDMSQRVSHSSSSFSGSESTNSNSASSELANLLREDPSLQDFNLITLTSTGDLSVVENKEALRSDYENNRNVYSYASWLLTGSLSDSVTTANSSKSGAQLSCQWSTERAKDALVQIERKLNIIQELAERISREKPEDVAGPLLRLHGYDFPPDVNVLSTSFHEEKEAQFGHFNRKKHSEENKKSVTTLETTYQQQQPTMTLFALRDRCDRLSRQSQVLEGVATRIESTLIRALHRLDTANIKLERVLRISRVLKHVMKLRFEASKVIGTGGGLSMDLLLLDTTSTTNSLPIHSSHIAVDLRELTRAAASVAIIEDLLNQPELKENKIMLVEQMRPEIDRLLSTVRKAAARLMEEQQKSSSLLIGNDSAGNLLSASVHFGATLQVYYYLKELPDAVWGAVSSASDRVEKVIGSLLNPSAVQRLLENARVEAKGMAVKEESSSGSSKSKGNSDLVFERMLKKCLREKRAEVASKIAVEVKEVALQIWMLYRVLVRKLDPITRRNFLNVVSRAPVPDRFLPASELSRSSLKYLGDRSSDETKLSIPIFSVFWNNFCLSLGSRLQKLLKYENGILTRDLVAMYPAIRSELLAMVKSINDVMHASSGSGINSDTFNGSSWTYSGVLGGSSVLDDSAFFDVSQSMSEKDFVEGVATSNSDSWTKNHMQTMDSNSYLASNVTSLALTNTFSSQEWNSLQGTGSIGLHPLQRAFVVEIQKRLEDSLEAMFPEAVNVDENGILISVFPMLPSKYDIEKIEKKMRDELSHADPRSGGGDITMVPMISECVVAMVEKFCTLAKVASSGIVEDKTLSETFAASESLIHDIKVANLMEMLIAVLRKLPETSFIYPYLPAHSIQNEEAANMCEIALLPALHEIDLFIKNHLLSPVTRAINRRLASIFGTIHRGAYIESSHDTGDTSFVQRFLTPVYEGFQSNILSKLSHDYATFIASNVAAFSIYCFVSNIALVRPLGENGKLRITQDLTDFELTLDQFILKASSGASLLLSRIQGGKPYAELRAVRHMLFWNGFENKNDSIDSLAKALLRELWLRDVRPSTIMHFILSFGNKLLSSPHHVSRLSAGEYVSNHLLTLDGSFEDGESTAWLTILSCCDSYQQRESLDIAIHGGSDKRVVALLLAIGPELMRRGR